MLFDAGIKIHREVVGNAYVDASLNVIHPDSQSRCNHWKISLLVSHGDDYGAGLA
ncbi:hypothetical protein CC80DRAFT_496952 [Byssothecium circinans]|uniref:Uncharacterized protein n=1 Tax=Byssothecium circinans TaxID=147558 RepID=A0A6A5TF07_9PLEO|nr:hypothetical protein CC80DRAFT_496952 [Byssothecium circinans]